MQKQAADPHRGILITLGLVVGPTFVDHSTYLVDLGTLFDYACDLVQQALGFIVGNRSREGTLCRFLLDSRLHIWIAVYMEPSNLKGVEMDATKRTLILHEMLEAFLAKDVAAADSMGDVHAVGIALEADITG